MKLFKNSFKIFATVKTFKIRISIEIPLTYHTFSYALILLDKTSIQIVLKCDIYFAWHQSSKQLKHDKMCIYLWSQVYKNVSMKNNLFSKYFSE